MNWEIDHIRYDEEDFSISFKHKVHGRVLAVSLEGGILNWQVWSKQQCLKDASADLAEIVMGGLQLEKLETTKPN